MIAFSLIFQKMSKTRLGITIMLGYSESDFYDKDSYSEACM